MSKGSKRRPCLITKEAEELQWDLLEGKISKTRYYIKRAILISKKKWWR